MWHLARFSIITCSRGFNHQSGWLWMNFTPVLCPKRPNSLQLRPLLLVLLAVLSASSPAQGKVIKPGLKSGNLFKQAPAGCLTQKDSKFPQTVRVNLSISNTNQDTRLSSLNASNRSLSPWDYRYGPCPYGLEKHWMPWPRNMLSSQFSVLQSWEILEIWGYSHPYNPLWNRTSTENSTKNSTWPRQFTEGKANYFYNLLICILGQALSSKTLFT